MPLLIFIYSMMWQLFCKYELPFWQDVNVESLILKDRPGPRASCLYRPIDSKYRGLYVGDVIF